MEDPVQGQETPTYTMTPTITNRPASTLQHHMLLTDEGQTDTNL
jgi:hypothetical protein